MCHSFILPIVLEEASQDRADLLILRQTTLQGVVTDTLLSAPESNIAALACSK